MREHHPHPREHGDGRDGFEKRPGRERGGRGPRVFAPGDLKLLLLALIGEQPCHGYDLIRQIEGMFDGAYSPSPGVIYPTLTFLEETELVTGDAEGGKKRYTITDAGRLSLSEQAIALEGVRMRIDVSKRSLRGHDRPPEIHEAVHNLRPPCSCTMGAGARKKSFASRRCSTAPPKPLSTARPSHLCRGKLNEYASHPSRHPRDQTPSP